LNIPTAPVVAYSDIIPPTTQTNGWVGTTELNANAFLLRPDIQALPIPTQIAMLRTNISFAGLNLFLQQATAEFDNQIANAQSILASAQQLGFYVSAVGQIVTAPSLVNFTLSQANDFDITGYVTNPTTFIIQNAGNFAGYGEIDWNVPTAGTFTITVTQNGNPISTTSSNLTAGPSEALPFSFTGNFAQGDVVQVTAQGTSTAQILATSYFSMIQTSSVPSPATPPVNVTDDTSPFTADASFPAGTAVQVQPDGGVAPLNLYVSAVSNLVVTAPNQVVVTVNGHYFVPSDIITFTGTSGTTPSINGPAVAATVTAVTPTTITATLYGVNTPMTWTASSGASGGTINLMDQSKRVVQYPLSDGVANAGTVGSSVDVGIAYGGQFGITGADFVVGGLIFAGMGGFLTQNWAAITATPLTITATADDGTTLTVTASTSVNLTGASALLYGLTTATFLNGRTVVVTGMTGTAPSYTGFTAAFSTTPYSTQADTGTANPAVDYVVCIGRAATATELIYEPHIPTLVAP
jgi:hypothetical protein